MASRGGSTSDVVIIGAGVIGAATALAMARVGWQVTVVDRLGAPGHGSTSASAGIVRVHAHDPESCLLAHEAVSIWSSWAAFLGATTESSLASFVRCGTVILDDGSPYIEQVRTALATAHLPHENWDAGQLSSHLPFIDARRFGPPRPVEDEHFWTEPSEALAGAVFTPDSGYVGDPALAAHNMIDAAVRHGAIVRLGTEVTGIERSRGRVTGVLLRDGTTIGTGTVLNAAGPHSSLINRLAGVGADFKVAVRQLREELHQVPAPPGVDYQAAGTHVVDGDLGINFRPESGNSILVGSNGAASDPVVPVADPDRYDERVTRATWDRQILRLARRFPGLPVPSRPVGVAGLYDVTEDWLPIYDRTDLPGFFVAMGTSGNQFKTAPVVGELIRQLIEADAAGFDLDTTPVWLEVPGSGRKTRSDTYSRLRSSAAGGTRG